MGQILKLFKLLNADVSPTQLAAGIAMGMVLGFTPLWSLHNVLTLFLICLLRINVAAVMASLLVCSGLAYLLDPLFIFTGEVILTNSELKPLFTQMYQQDIWRLAHFNHTVLMGSLVVSLLLFLPVLLLMRILIIKYREKVLAWVLKSKLVQSLKASKWFGFLSDVGFVTGVTD